MTIQVPAEREVVQEATQILLRHLAPSKFLRFWASWQQGAGDYLLWRDEEFANEKVSTLYDQIVNYQQE